MTLSAGPAVEDLRASMAGSVIGPDDEAYEQARTVWNAAIDRRPAMIARCASAADVVAAVTFARRQGLEVAVRGGAHSAPGHSVCDDGLVIDLSRLDQVTVDPHRRTARVQGGTLIGALDAATQAYGLAVPMGIVGHTGVAGLTLGGGMGWLTRQHGLSIDNLLAAEVVVADGRILRASPDENSDLFWAIRGGGGNFGVVTEFEFRLHEVGPLVHFAMLFWAAEQAAEALRVMRDVVADLPRDANAFIVAATNAPPAPFVPAEHHHKPGCALLLTGFGGPQAHQRIVDRVRASLPPLFDHVTPLPFVALQHLQDEANAWGSHIYDKGGYFTEIDDDMITSLAEHALRRTSPQSLALFYRLDGAYSEVGEDSTAFSGGRTPRYMGFFVAVCPTAESLDREREWVRSLWGALRPHMDGVGTYVNALESPDREQILDSYGAKYERLAAIKATYDPGNLFRHNVNITPA